MFLNIWLVYCIIFTLFFVVVIEKLKKNRFWKRNHPQSRSFERWICDQIQYLKIFKKFNMSQMNPKEVFHNTVYSVQLPYLAGQSILNT